MDMVNFYYEYQVNLILLSAKPSTKKIICNPQLLSSREKMKRDTLYLS